MTTTNPIDEILEELKDNLFFGDNSMPFYIAQARQALYSLLKERMPKEKINRAIRDSLIEQGISFTTSDSQIPKIIDGLVNVVLAEFNKVIDELCGKDKRMRVGRKVECPVCKLPKKPLGRSISLEAYNSYCNEESCSAYLKEPKPDTLFPNEKGEG